MPTRRKFRRNNRNKNKSRRKRQRGGKIEVNPIDNDTLTNILKGDEWKNYLTVDKFKEDRKEGEKKINFECPKTTGISAGYSNKPEDCNAAIMGGNEEDLKKWWDNMHINDEYNKGDKKERKMEEERRS